MRQRIARALFETRIGDRVLAWLERWMGLAVVEVGTLDKRELTPACD